MSEQPLTRPTDATDYSAWDPKVIEAKKEAQKREELQRLKDDYERESPDVRAENARVLAEITDYTFNKVKDGKVVSIFDSWGNVEFPDQEKLKRLAVIQRGDGTLEGGWEEIARGTVKTPSGEYVVKGLYTRKDGRGRDLFRPALVDVIESLTSENPGLSTVAAIQAMRERDIRNAAKPEEADNEFAPKSTPAAEDLADTALDNVGVTEPQPMITGVPGHILNGGNPNIPNPGVREPALAKLTEREQLMSAAQKRKSDAYAAQLKAEQDHGQNSHEFQVAHQEVEAAKSNIADIMQRYPI